MYREGRDMCLDCGDSLDDDEVIRIVVDEMATGTLTQRCDFCVADVKGNQEPTIGLA